MPIINHCLSQEFQCHDRLSCVHRGWVCDGDKDCEDGSDEWPDMCKNATCRQDQFACNNRECISGHLQCNGLPDCEDGSDELECRTFIKHIDRVFFFVGFFFENYFRALGADKQNIVFNFFARLDDGRTGGERNLDLKILFSNCAYRVVNLFHVSFRFNLQKAWRANATERKSSNAEAVCAFR